MVLKTVSEIWKCGITIQRDKNGDLELSGKNEIPAELLQRAQDEFEAIEAWYVSVEGECPVNRTMLKIYALFCGWQYNKVLNDWLTSDLESLDKVDRWLKVLQNNGMSDMYEDFREFKSAESDRIAQELYESAMAYVKGAKKDV